MTFVNERGEVVEAGKDIALHYVKGKIELELHTSGNPYNPKVGSCRTWSQLFRLTCSTQPAPSTTWWATTTTWWATEALVCPLSAPGSQGREAKQCLWERQEAASVWLEKARTSCPIFLTACHLTSCPASREYFCKWVTFWILDDILLIAQESLTSVDILKLARLVRVARCRIPQLSFQHWYLCSGSCRRWIGSLSTLQSYSPFSWSPSFSSPTGLPVFGKLVAQLDELCISSSR